jgi:hypothetical protein
MHAWHGMAWHEAVLFWFQLSVYSGRSRSASLSAHVEAYRDLSRPIDHRCLSSAYLIHLVILWGEIGAV